MNYLEVGTILASVSAFSVAIFAAFRKSRCTEIKCCGLEIKRELLDETKT